MGARGSWRDAAVAAVWQRLLGDLELAGQGSETWGRRAVLDSELSRDCQCAVGSGLLGYIG